VVPGWLSALSWIWLAFSFASAALIVVSEISNPQEMWLMNVVWLLTALYFGPLAVRGYWRIGSRINKRAPPSKKLSGKKNDGSRPRKQPRNPIPTVERAVRLAT
jgi:hypothetical protein